MKIPVEKDRQAELLEQLILEKYEPIAIVGVGIRFPGHCNDLATFESLLSEGREGISNIPKSRWDNTLYYDEVRGTAGKNCTDQGGYIDDFDKFDAKFFSISPKEANNMDPQQRIMLELVWEALENANINPEMLRGGNGSVYIGGSTIDFAKELVNVEDSALESHMATGAANSAISGRISYFLGLRGPSMTLDTACSSSLVALHLASNALRNRESDISLCGAVNLIHYPSNHIIFSQAGMLAPDGRCKTFDTRADGYGRSEGAAVLVLKRLSDALKDKNHVMALVRGTAVLQDGESGGLLVPNGFAQEQVMKKALKNSMCEAKDISYIEAHGTGTPLGDPIEIQAINRVFSESQDNKLMVASVKTNIGHMEATAGMGGIVKTILQFKNRLFYQHLNLIQPSEHIPWNELAIDVPIKPQEWKAEKRRALINSFGFAGTIASIVLEEMPEETEANVIINRAFPAILTISAKSEASLAGLLEKYRILAKELDEKDLMAFCCNSNIGRSHFNYRYADLISDKNSLLQSLDHAIGRLKNQGWNISKHKSNEVVFLYTGQGAQYINMGKTLYQRYPVFSRSLDECDYLFRNYLGCSIKAIMFNEIDNAESLLHQTSYTQPALFSIEYATTQLWLSWGVNPSMLMGHSIGEIVAATVAGLFSLADAVKLVSHRARLMQSVNVKGGMVAIQADHAAIEQIIPPGISYAAINSPSQCVISGNLEDLDSICENLLKNGINFTRLNVSHAFHSKHMDQILDKFRDSISDIEFNQPAIPFISNLTGKIASYSEVMSVEYWVKHIREPVQFLRGILTISERGSHTFIEMGPQPHLISLARQCIASDENLWLNVLKKDVDENRQILTSLMLYYLSGAKLAWHKINSEITMRYLALPLYSFDKRQYWLEAKNKSYFEHLAHPLLGKLTQSDDKSWIFTSTCSPDKPNYLNDHVVMGKIIFPAAGYIEMILAMQDQVFGHTTLCIKDFYIHEPLILSPKAEIQLKTHLVFDATGHYHFTISSYSDNSIRKHASGYLEDVEAYVIKEELLEIFQDSSDQPSATYTNEMLYKNLLEKGLAYGEKFRNASYVKKFDNKKVMAEIKNPGADEMTFLAPPILDAVLNSIDVLLQPDKLYLPVGFGHFLFVKKPKKDLQSKVKLRKSEENDNRYDWVADIILYDSQGPVFFAKELRLKTVTTVNMQKEDILYFQSWKPLYLKKSKNSLNNILFIGEKNLLTPKVNDYLNSMDNIIWVDNVEQAKKALLKNDFQKFVYFWKKLKHMAENEENLRLEGEINFKEILSLLRLLENDFFEKKVAITFVTEGGQVLPDDRINFNRKHNLIQSTLHGFNAVLINESPVYQSRVIDFDPLESEQLGNIKLLINELSQSDTNEFHQIAYRENNRYVSSLNKIKESQDNFVLEIKDYGTFANIQTRAIPIIEPDGDEILVRVEAAGLNFKDVINVLGLLKEHADKQGLAYIPLPLGFECSGTVVKAAKNAKFSVGDDVIVSHLGCMQRYITISSKAAVVAKPKNMRFDQAAAIPTAYITAYHALYNLAKIKEGDNILIHSGAGGVGQAAIQLAKRIRAKIITSASYPKWSFLKEQGIEDIINSREPAFADHIKSLTHGKGVDVVLNCFNKAYIQEGFNALDQGGRFVELGKIGVWNYEMAKNYRSDIDYYNFDLSELPKEELNELNRTILESITSYLNKGEVQPLPTTVFGLSQLEDAFSLLSKGENLGKIVIDFNECRTINNTLPISINAERTYLITGGYGALGQYAIKWLAEQGAKYIALMGRSSVTPSRLEELNRFLSGTDVKLIQLQGDISKREDVERCFSIIRNEHPSLGGIIHAAGVIKDGPINIQTWENFDTLFSSKVYGTWLLNEYAKNENSDLFFVGYSSVASVVGSAGQANYSAANAFIDSLMAWRSSYQRHGLSINWGPWSEVGMAAHLDQRKSASIEKKGVKFIDPNKAMLAFSDAVVSRNSQIIISQFDWKQYAENMSISNFYFQSLLPRIKKQSNEFSVEEIKELSVDKRVIAVNKMVRSKLALALHFDNENDIELDSRFSDLGLDSLVSVEFKNIIEKTFKIPLKMSDISDYPSIPSLSSLILEQLSLTDQ